MRDMRTVRCDHCGLSVDTLVALQAHWYVILRLLDFDDDPTENYRRFCSVTCLRAYVGGHCDDLLTVSRKVTTPCAVTVT